MDVAEKRNVAKMKNDYVEQQTFAGIAAARRKKMLIRRLMLFFVFSACISYFMLSSILSQSSLLAEKVAQQKQLNKQLSDLKGQQQNLQQQIKDLNNDDYIAKLARKEYFLSKKNEIIFNIPDDGKKN